ncbi:MAG: acetate--CoA ligase family protein [Ignavibacteriaceae bacterium]|jgi:acetyltransferase|nr:acetate--CoA ligase family protein [Chlorobium sp.]MCW8960400.1 acetate--CoA ligase family protein [Ignavibacteriaceae bacterium]MCW8994532.1 acetate--CoA ligase family protein [Psychromonas sp.]MCW9097277.1 acetate--CoA ligase family protein [Ignavibacteriaceae bacterium]
MLDSLFNPKSVAIIGASTKELSIGNVITKNLLHYKYKGAIYPINPNADEVRGIKAYKTISDVPGDVDLAHISIPSKFVPQAVDDCGKKGVKFIIINSAGFKEVGPEGEALEKEIVSIAKKYGVRLFGPNCQGIINSDPDVRAYCDFTFTFPDPGHISVVAQSGGVGAVIMQRFFDLGVGMRYYASNGNACDISIEEIIRYWGDDEKTKVIVLYVEGFADPKSFMEMAYEVAAKKPILAMRGGRTEEGAKAATSHTGGLAGIGLSTELIFNKTGILTFRDEEEMCQAAIAFATQPIPRGNRVGLITDTGGPAIIATDEFVDLGLEIPPLSDKGKSFLKDKLYADASINNPIDVLATAAAPHYRAALDTLINEDQIDSIYINFVTPPFADTESIAKEMAEVSLQRKKPIICNYMTDKAQWTGTTNILKGGGIPCYDFPEMAAKALAALTRFGEIRSRKTGEVKKFTDVSKNKAETIFQEAKKSKRQLLSSQEVYDILTSYNIPVAEWKVVKTDEEAEKVAEEIGYPVVIKAESALVIHKSDVGGVVTNIKDKTHLRKSIEQMKTKLKLSDLNFLVQKYLPGGRELIVGAKAEPGLGHLIMFGMGGIFVEVFKDVIFKIAPVSNVEAGEMLSSIKASPLIEGIRGEKGVNKDSVLDIIQRISQLVTDFPIIQEMDLNPVIAFENSNFVVDARIKI